MVTMRHGRAKRRIRKPKLSKEDLGNLAFGLNKFGDMYVMMGEIEEEVGDFGNIMRKLERSDPVEILLAIDADPALTAKTMSFIMGFDQLSSLMEKDLSEMPPGEKIELGEGLKELADLFAEIVESIEEKEDL